jgi:BASS family bile acid:Na+ symporter
LSRRILDFQFPVSLGLFALINLGVFSKYSSFLFQRPDHIVMSLGIAYGLSAAYCATGFLVTRGAPLDERLAAAVSLGIMNNVLVIVFSARFFGPLCPVLAAMYMFPFYTLIIPLRLIGRPLAAETPAAGGER